MSDSNEWFNNIPCIDYESGSFTFPYRSGNMIVTDRWINEDGNLCESGGYVPWDLTDERESDDNQS